MTHESSPRKAAETRPSLSIKELAEDKACCVTGLPSPDPSPDPDPYFPSEKSGTKGIGAF